MPELLDKAGLLPTDLARLLGVSDSFISQVTKGNGKPTFSYELARNAARVLRCKMEELHEWNDE